MREFRERVQWGWIKAHSERKGWFYERHNKCDHAAGATTEDDGIAQARFAEWDRDYVLVDAEGQRVEGDVRCAVRQSVCELSWNQGLGGRSMERWSQMTKPQKKTSAVNIPR